MDGWTHCGIHGLVHGPKPARDSSPALRRHRTSECPANHKHDANPDRSRAGTRQTWRDGLRPGYRPDARCDLIVIRFGAAKSRLREVARRYRRFPLLLAPSGLLNILGTQLPVLLLAYFYGIAVAGWMGLAQRVLAVPVTLLGTTVAQVYLAELARSKRSRFSTAGSLFTRASRSLLTVGALVGLVLLIGGPQLFALVFGQEWAISGKYAQAMSLGLTAQFIGTPLSQTLIVYERQMLQLSWDTARLVLVSTAIVVASATGTSALGAVWALSLASALAYSLSWLLSWRVIRGLSEIATGTGKLSGSSSAATPGGEDPVEGS
jgi:O-antigen/teichoic acid export membrane protein